MNSGKNKQHIKTDLEKLNFSELSCEEALKHVAKMIEKNHDETKSNYQLI